MLYLIGGENVYASQKRLDELKHDFMSRFDGVIKTFYADEISDPDEILADVDSVSLFNQERLIVIKRLFSARKDFIEKIAGLLKSKKKCNCIFWEAKALDKRRGVYKYIKRKGNVEEFSKITFSKLRSWIKKLVGSEIEISNDAIEKLILKLGDDQMQLEKIINNLVSLVTSENRSEILEKDIDNFVEKTTEESIWDLVDALGEYNKPKALEILEEMMRDMGDFVKIVGMLTRQLRILALVKYMQQQGSNQGQIVRRLKLHPFVVRKSISHARNFSFKKLRKLYQKLTNTDLVVKQGKFEEKLVLNLFIAAL